jgi:hypothetical protein
MTDTPNNTTAEPPEAHLLGLMSGSDAYIEGMEARGQRELVRSEVLPTEILRGTDADFEALGFTFGDPVDGDPMFRKATLPDGWTKQGTDHSMWSKVVDHRGIERAAIFYKAAFYDRSAHMSLSNVGWAVSRMISAGEEWAHLLDQLTADEVTDLRQALAADLETTTRHRDYWAEQKDQRELLDDYEGRLSRLAAARQVVGAE